MIWEASDEKPVSRNGAVDNGLTPAIQLQALSSASSSWAHHPTLGHQQDPSHSL